MRGGIGVFFNQCGGGQGSYFHFCYENQILLDNIYFSSKTLVNKRIFICTG
jgi:hypothetical protein